ncbi:hypothetical protein LMH87_001805 [Akanthomyces muscarius]|uniref:Uncharacterized protein n=1 Tax=Akanthomyces muscarius TaxID=2231603 RepID=A0A9W8Q5K9_AKAMU|nr:hypothetical protein LMH87_001805 [Akanthomyces muscarius]KAJ4147269.1 hypothetical protein LMH87_001805 [Akanthomyces muscarius]
MLTWQNGPDADFRAIYMLSLKHREVLSWVARHDWRPPYCPPFRDAPQPLPPPSPSPPALPEPRNPPLPTRAGQNVPAEYEPGREAEPSTQELRDMVLVFRNRFEDGEPALKREPED